MVETANYIWRDWNTDGVPASQISKPEKRLIREWGTWVEALLGSGSAGGTWYATRALMNADLAHDAGTLGIVYADPNPALNGMYVKQGASGTGSWTQISNQLPTGAAVVAVTVTGGGPNALTASFNPNTQFSPGQAIYILRGIAADNTGPVSINGKPYRTNLGSDFAAGGIKAGGVYLFVDNGPEYRSLTDQDIAALVTQAEDAANRAEDAAAIALGATPNSFPATRADMAAQATTVVNSYLIEPGFEDFFHLIDITSGIYDDLIAADTVGGEIVISDNDSDLAYLRERDYNSPFKLSQFDGDLAVTLAVAEKRSALMGGGIVTVEINVKGRVVVPASITVPKNVNLIGLGSKDTILDFNTATLSAPDTGLLPLAIKAWGGGLTEVPIEWTTTAVGEAYLDMDEDPSSYAEDGAVYIVYDSTDGSWLNLSNRPYYRRGEMKRMVRQEGNRLWFDRAFRDVYASGGAVKLYKMDPYRGKVGGFSIDMTGRAIAAEDAIDIRFGDNNDVYDLFSYGAGYSGIQWNICYNLTLRNSFATTRVRAVFPGSGNPGNDYGIVYSNSTGTRIRDCSATANWHALSLGGGAKIGCVPTYDTIVDGGHYVSTYNVQAVDMHGICEMTRYKNMIIDGPVSIAGKDSSYENCKITSVKTGRSGGGPDLAVAGAEIWGGLYEFINCDIYSDCQGGGPTGGVSHGGFDFSFQHATIARRAELHLHVTGGRINFPNETRPFHIENTHATHSTSVSIDTELILPSATAAGIVRVVGAPTNVAKYFRIKQVSAAAAGSPYAVWNSGYTASSYEFPDQMGTVTVTGNTGVSFVSNTVTPKHGYPIAPLVDAWAPGGTIAGRLVVGSCNATTAGGPWTVYANSAPGTNFASTATGTMAWRACLRA